MVKPKEILKDLSYSKDSIKKTKQRLKLDCNENIYGVSNFVLSAIKNIEESDISLYPDDTKCISRLCEKFAVNKENILLTNGRTMALQNILTAFIDNDEEFLYFKPLDETVENFAKCINVNLKPLDYNNDFSFNNDDFIKNITQKTKVIYLSCPNYTSGSLIRPSMLELIIKEYPEILFVLDVTYIAFAQNSVEEDFLDLTKKYDNIAIIKSYSIDYAFAGLKAGYVIAYETIINELKKISDSNISSPALIGILAEENDKNRKDEIKEQNAKNKELLFEGLKNAGFTPYESEANFVLCDFSNYCDFYYKKFKNNGISVKKFENYSKLASCLRITVPKEGGVKYILELVKKKDVLIFNPDRIIFNVENSYFAAVKKSVELLTNEKIDTKTILQVKNLGRKNSDIGLIKKIINDLGYDAEYDNIKEVFKKALYSKNDLNETIIDTTSLKIQKEILEALNKKYDIVLLSNHTKAETQYLLELIEVEDLICNIFSKCDFEEDSFEDNTYILSEIFKHTPYNKIKFLTTEPGDIISANALNIDTIGTIANEKENNLMTNNFKHIGVKYILNDIQKTDLFLKELEENN